MVIKSSAHYQREYRKRLREQGLVKKEIWILPEQRPNARLVEKELRKPLSANAGSPVESDGSNRAKWRTGALFGELSTTDLVRSGKASIEIIDGAEPTMMITMHEYGDLPVFMTVSGEQIIAESILWPASNVKDQAAFNETILRTQNYYPLSTICLGKRADEDHYLMEGSLSSASRINEIILEIETLANNVIRVTEAYIDILQ